MSMDQGIWDSTLSRMIGRLSHPSSSQWLSGGQDFYASQLIGQMELEQSSAWLGGAQEESRMRPLVGELDESAAQRSGSSGERTRVDPTDPDQAVVLSDPAGSPEAQPHISPVSGVNTQDLILQTTTCPTQHNPERTEVIPAQDSFHPLLAEITHNETLDPSMTFHLPEGSISPEGCGQSPGSDHNLSTHSEGSTEHDPSVESEPSPEHVRAEEMSCCLPAPTALQISLFQLTASQCHPYESVLVASPTTQEAEPASLSLSSLTLYDAPPTLDPRLPEGGDAEHKNLLEGLGGSVQICNLDSGEPNMRSSEAACEKGILEESEITLVSLTDTTLQDQDTTITEEVDKGQEECKEESEEGRKGEKEEEFESISFREDTSLKEESTQPHAVLLEFQWNPRGGLQQAFQQKRKALLQRSNHRVEDIKTKRALTKAQPQIQGQSQTQGRSKAKDPQPIWCKSKTRIESEFSTKGGQLEDKITDTSCFVTARGSKQKKPQPPVSDTSLKRVCEVTICTHEERKRDVSEMHQRTQRLYDQLEEVKRQKEIKSRQEAYAQNRLKAKEFHKKTLQKLRAKQTPR